MATSTLLCILFGFVVVVLARNAFTSGLSHVPGPWLARFTDIWRTSVALNEKLGFTLQNLHNRYGSVVRIGPNICSIADPKAIEKIYGVKADLPKSDYLKPTQTLLRGKIVPIMFNTQDKDLHAALRKPVSNVFSMSTLKHFEPFVDDNIRALISTLDQRFISGEHKGTSCDIYNWLRFFAFDFIGDVTMSRRFGFLESGQDAGGLLAALDAENWYRGVFANIPWMDNLFKKNPVLRFFSNKPGPFIARARVILEDRLSKGGNDPGDARHDFVARLVDSGKALGDKLPDTAVTGYVSTLIVAGADTTSAALQATVYNILKHPEVLRRLLAELDNTVFEFPVSNEMSQSLVYLDAVIREALRCYPVATFLMERVVSGDGLIVPDQHMVLPAGTIVAIPSQVVQKDPVVYGSAPNEYNPDRWLQRPEESDVEFKARFDLMKATDMTFGKGRRACLGKNIAHLELYKLIPSLFRVFDIRLLHPEKEMRMTELFVARYYDFDVEVKWRDGMKEKVFPSL